MEDGQEILGELGLSGTYFLIEDHEFGVLASAYPVQELEGEPAETIAVGNDNLTDASLQDEVHHLQEPPAFEVEAGADVADDAVLGVALLEHLRLAFEVVALLGGADAAVDEALADDDGLALRLRGREADAAVVPAGGLDALDLTILDPSAERGVGDLVLAHQVLRSEVL
jgi:hypothetical protein